MSAANCTHRWHCRRTRYKDTGDGLMAVTPARCIHCGERRTFRSRAYVDWSDEALPPTANRTHIYDAVPLWRAAALINPVS